MDNALLIACLIAAFVWIQILTPPTRAKQQKENSPLGESRGVAEQR